jgi:hypothetical protein
VSTSEAIFKASKQLLTAGDSVHTLQVNMQAASDPSLLSAYLTLLETSMQALRFAESVFVKKLAEGAEGLTPEELKAMVEDQRFAKLPESASAYLLQRLPADHIGQEPEQSEIFDNVLSEVDNSDCPSGAFSIVNSSANLLRSILSCLGMSDAVHSSVNGRNHE